MNKKAPELSMIIPVFNESSIVQTAAVERCSAREAQGADLELILAENGSKGSTADIVGGLSRRKPWVSAVNVDRIAGG